MVKKKEMKNINTKLYIDGHIHFYENFSPELFFKSAEKNFLKYHKNGDNKINVLVFSEGKQFILFFI